METRELHYMDAKSSKFWRIELNGSSHTVTYGKIGASGTSATKEFDSPAAAQKSYQALLKEKLAKGYVDAPTQSATAPDTASDGLPFHAFPCTRDDNTEHAANFMGLKVVSYDPKKKHRPTTSAFFFGASYEENNFDAYLDSFLASDLAAETPAIVIGPWSEEMPETTPDDVIAKLVAAKDRLGALRGIFLGDITQEENEMSWICQADVTPLLAFENLELLRVRGGQGLSLSANHARLRALAIETGGLDASVVRSLLMGNLPNLEYLELWIGTEEYGRTVSVEDLQPLLAGQKFPKLRYLGLRNCDIVDEVAAVVVNAPIVHQLETLDLSLGTLSDAGGEALLKLPTAGPLKKLDLHYNFLSKEMAKRLKNLPISVDTSGTNESEDEDWRFVAVGE